MGKIFTNLIKIITTLALVLCIAACSSSKPHLASSTLRPSYTTDIDSFRYLIGPSDSLNIFVWRNPEVSGTFTVRPDGMITTSLVEDIPVSGQTPTQFARSIEKILSTYIRDPIVTVTVGGFVGPYSEQIRIIGEAAQPQALNYKQYMTLLDVMIQVGGLTEYADADNTILLRIEEGVQKEYIIEVNRLLKDGDISANVDMLPGDIIIVPEAWF